MSVLRRIVGKHLSGKKVLLLFVLTNLVYAVMIFITIPKVMVFSGDLKILDMMPTGYDLDYVNALFNALGEKGRETYLYQQIPVDMIYPFLFGISNSLILAFFLNKMGKLDSVFFYVTLLPLLAGIADYMENFGIVVMLTSFPDVSAEVAGLPLLAGIADYMENFGIVVMLISFPDVSVEVADLTNVFSITKSVTTTIFFIVLIIILVSLGLKTLGKFRNSGRSK